MALLPRTACCRPALLALLRSQRRAARAAPGRVHRRPARAVLAGGALDAVARHRATVFPGVATMFRRVLDSPRLDGADLSSVRLALPGAAPCPWDLAQQWRTRTGIRILRGYGMTELFRPISYLAATPPTAPTRSAAPCPGSSCGRSTTPDSRSPRVRSASSGSRARPRWTAISTRRRRRARCSRTVVQDGRSRRFTADGFVRIVGRKRELILRGGYSVFPAEVEAALLGHPAVAEAAVIGVAARRAGRGGRRLRHAPPGLDARPEELIAHCRDRLAAYKYPRRVVIVDELPKGATGKILKSRLPGGG